MLAYQYFLKVAPDGTGGVTDRNGYFAFALFCSVVILVVILISARATQWIVPWLSKPARDGGGPWRAFGASDTDLLWPGRGILSHGAGHEQIPTYQITLTPSCI